MPKAETKKREGLTAVQIYEELQKRILRNELKAAQPLRQDDIAMQFGVSKIPVREALRQLESEGLVEFKPRRGAFVVELSEAEVIEVLEIRIALESRAIELAIPNMTEADILSAKQILDEYEKVSSFELWSDLNNRFHQCLYNPCGLPKLVSMIQSIKNQAGLFMQLRVTQAAGFDRPHKEHMELLEACEAADVKQGVKLIRQHIENTKKEVAAYFRNQRLLSK